MLNDFRSPLAEDPSKRIAELEAENAVFRIRIRQLTKLFLFAFSSLFCLMNVMIISNILSLYNQGNFYIYSLFTGTFLFFFLIFTSLVLNSSSSGIATSLKKIISSWDILRWMLIPIGVTGLIILMLWGLVSLISRSH